MSTVVQNLENMRCLVVVRGASGQVADRLEAFARSKGMEVVDSIFLENAASDRSDGKETVDNSLEQVRYYIDHDSISTILIREIWDLSTDKEEIRKLLEFAEQHGISINEEQRGYLPASLVWDGGNGC